MAENYYVYIITNIINTVLYTGVTNDLKRRVFEHKEGTVGSFSKRYNLYKLIYYEVTMDVTSAIVREKQIKKMLRKEKEELINGMNKGWRDLYMEL